MTRAQHIAWDPSLCIEFDSKSSLTHHFSRRAPLMRFINDLQTFFSRIIFEIKTQTQKRPIHIGTKIRIKRCPLFKIWDILYIIYSMSHT